MPSRHDTDNPEAVLRVPVPARVAITAPDAATVERGQYLAAMVTRLGQREQAIELSLAGPHDAPHLLLPGRYRIALVVARHVGDDRYERTPLGSAVEVELVADETARVPLR